MTRQDVVGLALAWFLMGTNASAQSSVTPERPVPEFVVDSASPVRAEELRRDAENLSDPQCNGHYTYLGRPTSIGEFIGGTAKIVRVTRYVHTMDSVVDSEPQAILRKVWSGQFKSAACQINWAEVTVWSTEGVVELDDGKRSRLITDGYHIALQDHAGRSWFIRLNE